MTIESPSQFAPAREARRGDRAGGRRRSASLRWLGGLASALAVLVFAALVAVWPTLTLLALGFTLVTVLALFAPPFALVGTILLYGLEGMIKVGLAHELPALGVTPEAFGAALLDAAFLVAVLGLLRQDRGRTLVAIWRNSGSWTRVALSLLAAWLAISLLQVPLTSDLDTALAGFRLTQVYVLAVLAGAVLLARCRPEHVVAALVGVLLIIAAYAAFRAVAGPAPSERLAAFTRSTTPLVPSENGVIFRNTGSISSAIGLASFLVPAGVLLFALGLFLARLRLAAWTGLAFVLVALVGTYVRTSLLALAGGAVCAAALFTFTSALRRRTKIGLGLASAPLLVVLLVIGALVPNAVSGGSPEVALRSAGVLKPLSDASLELRFQRWRESLDVVKENPLGTGVGTVGAATRDREGTVRTFADNSYLKILQEQGPLGAVPFILGVFATLIAAAAGVARRAMPLRGLGTAAVTASVSFFLLAWTSEAIEQPGKVLAWLLLGVALWVAFGSPKRERGSGEGGPVAPGTG